ncbi:hypothetical protein E1B28_002156 [Marasmius oreades]|uniref:Uncharacterized protein n=1 Tax=Marasmius oreades TaxID=181124 RepID=A0A9P7UKZ7_9AGAR|nr:uncharacterized protein E1B28_002156 [Marasmius oreades]KAG7086193.1 hypothetical protein E1B28_002156 [Marasmius oreades]
MNLNETVVCFLAVTFESLLFGISLALLAFTLKELLRPPSVNWRMFALICMFFTLSIIGYSTMLYSNITFTILVTRGAVENTAVSYAVFFYSGLSTTRRAICLLPYMGSGLLADAVVVIQALAKKMGIGLTMYFVDLSPSAVGTLVTRLRASDFNPEREQVARIWSTISICLSLATNLLSTGLLAYKVYSVNMAAGPYRLSTSSPTLAMNILRVVVESGIIYSVWLIVGLVLLVTRASITRVFLSLNSIIPITFYLIIIRLGQARRKESESTGMESGMVFRTTTNSDFTDFTFTTIHSRRNAVGTLSNLSGKGSFGKSVGSLYSDGYTSPPLSPRSLPRKGSVVRVIEHGHELAIRTGRSSYDASTVTLGSNTSPSPQSSLHLRKGSQDSSVMVIQSAPTGPLKEVPEAVIKG